MQLIIVSMSYFKSLFAAYLRPRLIISILCCRFSDANCRKAIVGLLKRVGEAYALKKLQSHFLKDLITFGVPDLLKVPQDGREVKELFIDMIHTFVRKNALKEVLLGQILFFVVSKK